MTALPFRDDAFDAVTAFHSLIHVLLADHGTVADEEGTAKPFFAARLDRVGRRPGRLRSSQGAPDRRSV